MATPIPSNHCSFTLGEITRATAGFSSGSELNVQGVFTDTRAIVRRGLFVALRGVRDGHNFLREAAARGAAAAVVERGRAVTALPCIEVEDTLGALGHIAHFHLERSRALHTIQSIAIGGAAGKTTTKELTAALVRALWGETLSTPGNMNNLIGVPLTLLTLTEAHRAMVIECGTNQRGEIARLREIVKADVAMVLNADLEHTEGLGTLEDVADEEASLFPGARLAIACREEELITARIPPGMSTLTFGSSGAADIRLSRRALSPDGKSRIAIELKPGLVESGAGPATIEADFGLLGSAAALNAAAAVAAAVASLAKPATRTQLDGLAAALAAVTPVAGRLQSRKIGELLVIDDSYNANPRSVRAALDATIEIARSSGRRMIVLLGDMLELGELARSAHCDTVRDLFARDPEIFIAVGTEMASACREVSRSLAHPVRTTTFAARDSEEAGALASELAQPGDVILVKGSRGLQMERAIERLAS